MKNAVRYLIIPTLAGFYHPSNGPQMNYPFQTDVLDSFPQLWSTSEMKGLAKNR